ncbi:hypothetical protein CDD80_1746 [Ophiocordyceps camponoti-rufipedis]|uniref:Uncharacterized protein n=1 Tax=Ophiocordyceps camponoti-rufipedis TaxID=2004952 RepID=A0A2C5XW36_9HYPO|nr:hypothetical protein CDD80_1746 [Ophiocordyceps camponoti-rufipedis]
MHQIVQRIRKLAPILHAIRPRRQRRTRTGTGTGPLMPSAAGDGSWSAVGVVARAHAVLSTQTFRFALHLCVAAAAVLGFFLGYHPLDPPSLFLVSSLALVGASTR